MQLSLRMVLTTDLIMLIQVMLLAIRVSRLTKKAKKAQLPQTGDKKATGLTVFGMLVSLLGMADLSISDRFKKLSKAKKSK